MNLKNILNELKISPKHQTQQQALQKLFNIQMNKQIRKTRIISPKS